MDNPTLILNRLFLISVMAGKYKTQAMYAKKAMFSIAARFPDMFLDMIISEIAPDSKNQITAMAALSIIAKEWDPVYVPFISRIVKIFLIALDPVSPSTRSNLTTAVSRTIEYLTGAYPMVSFERESQRIAVCEFSSLSIFDTKTGKLIFKALLEAGTLATALSPTGKSVAVLTSEGYIYVWQLTNNKSASATAKKADRIFTVPCPDTVSLASPSKDIRLEWTIGMLCLRLPKIEKLIKYPMDKSL